MTKTDKFGGKQHIKYSKNEEAIGDLVDPGALYAAAR